MGMGYDIICTNPKCRYHTSLYSGSGFRYPDVYNEILQKAKDGLISDAHTQFFIEHPNGIVNAEDKIYECQECAHLFSEPSLDMYIPKEIEEDIPSEAKWSIAFPADGTDYVTSSEWSYHYKLFKRHPHFCPNCGGKAKVKRKIERVTEKCPLCGSTLQAVSMLWD